ncbi:MAG: ZIP family metal transporter [Solirubrobacterales bacterium]
MDYLTLVLAASGTALATGVGAIPVFLLGSRAERLRSGMWGFAAGTMGVASVVGLLLPAFNEGSDTAVWSGVVAGAAFVLATQLLLKNREPRVAGLRGRDVRSSVLVFAVLFVHSAPEGLAIGTAYASHTGGLGLFVILAIALQNVPEGTSVAIPMAQAGFSARQQFWAAVGTSAPQPVAAVAAFALVDAVAGLLPFSFGFAAGAMFALVAIELAPRALVAGWRGALAGATAGAALMLALSALLGV